MSAVWLGKTTRTTTRTFLCVDCDASCFFKKKREREGGVRRTYEYEISRKKDTKQVKKKENFLLPTKERERHRDFLCFSVKASFFCVCFLYKGNKKGMKELQ